MSAQTLLEEAHLGIAPRKRIHEHCTYLEGPKHVVVLMNQVVAVIHVVAAVWLNRERKINLFARAQIEHILCTPLPRVDAVITVLLRRAHTNGAEGSQQGWTASTRRVGHIQLAQLHLHTPVEHDLDIVACLFGSARAMSPFVLAPRHIQRSRLLCGASSARTVAVHSGSRRQIVVPQGSIHFWGPLPTVCTARWPCPHGQTGA
eukprot:1195822-Prorocentrum_minimum.AAC.4